MPEHPIHFLFTKGLSGWEKHLGCHTLLIYLIWAAIFGAIY